MDLDIYFEHNLVGYISEEAKEIIADAYEEGYDAGYDEGHKDGQLVGANMQASAGSIKLSAKDQQQQTMIYQSPVYTTGNYSTTAATNYGSYRYP
jgi:hypothetical protein